MDIKNGIKYRDIVYSLLKFSLTAVLLITAASGTLYSQFKGGDGRGDFVETTPENQTLNGDATVSFTGGVGRGDFTAVTAENMMLNGNVINMFAGGSGRGDLSGSTPDNQSLNGPVYALFTGGSGSGDASAATPVNTPLPVTLSTFTSSVSSRDVKLNWVTSSEINNAGFEVQKSVVSSEKSEWRKIGYISGKGTTNEPTTYNFEDKKLATGKYQYRLKQIDNNGNFEYHNLNGEVEVGVPTKYEISQNYPNPFNPMTKIDFQLPNDGKVSLKIYDITGREIAVLVNNEFKKADYYTVMFNGSSLSSGVYFYRIEADKYVMTKKMVLVK